MTQKNIILKLLRDEPTVWFKSYDLHQRATQYGFLGPTGRRRTQELAKDGLIDVRHEGGYAEYRAKGPKMTIVRSIPDLGTSFQETIW